MYPFSEIGDSFRLYCSCLSIIGASDIVLLSCSLFVFKCISNISSSENQPFFIIVLTWSASLRLIVRKRVYSWQISIMFSISSNCVIASKIAVQCELVVFPCPCFVFAYDLCGSLNHHSCTWKKNSQHSQDNDQVFHVGYLKSTCLWWHPGLLLPRSYFASYFEFDIFIMACILWLYYTLGLLKICAPNTDVT